MARAALRCRGGREWRLMIPRFRVLVEQFHSYAIEDELVVPADLAPGEYVLGWRWDCEMTSQVWSSCADITIV